MPPSASDYNFASALNSVVPQPSVELQASRVVQLAQELQQQKQQVLRLRLLETAVDLRGFLSWRCC